MLELLYQIPNAEVLLEIEPEELGEKIVLLAKKIDGGYGSVSNNRFQIYHAMRRMPLISFGEVGTHCILINSAAYPENKFDELMLAINEAFSWLVAQGLLVPNGSLNSYYLSRRARRLRGGQDFADFATARLLQRDMLHPLIATAAWQSFMRGAYPTAVFEAMRQVEIAVREAAGFAQGEHGVPMIRRAFGKSGPLSNLDADEAEREYLCALFAGAVGTYKNPHSHRIVPMESAREAAEIVMLASHLLRVVDARVAARRAESDAR